MRDVQSSSPRDPTIHTVVVPSRAGRSYNPGSPSVLGSGGKSLMGMIREGRLDEVGPETVSARQVSRKEVLMRGLRCCAAAVAVAGITGLTPLSAGRAFAQEAHTLTITVPGASTSVSNRVVAALAEQGVTVAVAQGAVIQTAPYRFNPATDVVLTANLVQHDSTTSVIFSGTFSVPTLGLRSQPMTASTSHLKGQLWAWLEAIAKKVEAAPAS